MNFVEIGNQKFNGQLNNCVLFKGVKYGNIVLLGSLNHSMKNQKELWLIKQK